MKINENKKITFGQLKRLIKESWDKEARLLAAKNLRDYAANKIIGGHYDKEWEIPFSSAGGVHEAERIVREAGYSYMCGLGDAINFQHKSPMEYDLVRSDDGGYAVTLLEGETERSMRLYLVDVEPIREYAEILDPWINH